MNNVIDFSTASEKMEYFICKSSFQKGSFMEALILRLKCTHYLHVLSKI